MKAAEIEQFWLSESYEPNLENVLSIQETVQLQCHSSRTDYEAMFACPDGVDSAAWQFEYLRWIGEVSINLL